MSIVITGSPFNHRTRTTLGEMQFFTHYINDNIALPAPDFCIIVIIGGVKTSGNEQMKRMRVEFKYASHMLMKKHSNEK